MYIHCNLFLYFGGLFDDSSKINDVFYGLFNHVSFSRLRFRFLCVIAIHSYVSDNV